MSEDFECDFSEGSLCEKKAVYKKKQNDREIHLTNMNNNNKNSAHHFQIKKDSDKLKSSKLAKKNLKYFLIYYDGNLCHTIIRNILKERRLEISSDSEIDFSKNVYLMLIDYHRKLVEGILKKDYMKESIEDTTKKKLYKFKQEIVLDELANHYSLPNENLIKIFKFDCKNVGKDIINIGRGLSMMEIMNDELVDTFESIRNSMINKEKLERKKLKRSSSHRKNSRSSSSSEHSYVKRKKSKNDKVVWYEMKPNYDMNYFKLQYDNYLKNAAAYLAQNMGNVNNLQNIHNISHNNPNGINPLLNQIYSGQFINYNNPQYKTEKNVLQNNFNNLSLMPQMFPILNPYMPIFPMNNTFSQVNFPLGNNLHDNQKNKVEKINTNNYNIINNTSSGSKSNKSPIKDNIPMSSDSESDKSSTVGKYFDLKYLNEYKELESQMKKEKPEINLNDSKLMDHELLIDKPKGNLNLSCATSDDNNDEFFIDNNMSVNAEIKEVIKLDKDISVKNHSNRSKYSKYSNSNLSYSSNSRLDRLSSSSRRDNKKFFGNKRKRSLSSRISSYHSHSMSSSLSREKFEPKYRNELKHSNYLVCDSKGRISRKYNRYSGKYKNQTEFNENKRKRQYNYNNYHNNYGNYHPRYERKFKYTDGDTTLHKEMSAGYSENRFKPFSRENDKNVKIESTHSTVKQRSKEIKEDSESYNLKEKTYEINNDHYEDNKEIINLSGQIKREYNKKKVSHFSDIPNDSTIYKSDINREAKIKFSNFSDTPINYHKNNMDQVKDEINNSIQSYYKNKTNNRKNNSMINYKRNRFYHNANYRNESINKGNSFVKNSSDLKDKTQADLNEDIYKNNFIVPTPQVDSTFSENPPKLVNEVIRTSEVENRLENEVITKINEPASNSILTDPINLPTRIIEISDNIETTKSSKEKSLIHTNKVISQINEELMSTRSMEKSIMNKATVDFNRNVEIGQETINNHILEMSSMKSNQNESSLESTNNNTVLNQTCYRKLIDDQSQIKLISTIKLEESLISKPRIATDLSSMLHKDNNFKIINVLGKKKIILNKDRKNPDIKLKNYK